MDKFRIIATRYNIINIVSTISLTMIFFLQFRYAFIFGLFTDDDSAAILLFWPILLLIAIIAINKNYIRKTIHRELKYHYEANNMNYDEAKDLGSLTEEEKSHLPKYNHLPRTRLHSNFDMQFWGNLDDLGINYQLDKFEYKYTQKRGVGKHEHTETIFSFNGDGLVINYNDRKPFTKPIVFFNRTFNGYIKNGVLSWANKEVLKEGEEILGYLNYNEEDMNKEEVENTINMINSVSNFFKKRAKIFVIFNGDRIVVLTDEQHKFKIRISFLIRKKTIEELISDQKGNIYRFNMLLNKVSQI